MTPTIKLTYFNGKGRAECIRLILSYLGLKFEDVRIVFGEFEEFKKKSQLELPLGMLPILEIDGKALHQSISICRFLAKKYHLAGNNEWDATQCDIVADSTQDIYKSIWDYRMATGSDKETHAKTMKTVTIPKFLSYFNKTIKDNNGFTVASQITWSDIVVSFLVEELIIDFTKTSVENYPEVVALKEKIYSDPKIAAWIANRPEEAF